MIEAMSARWLASRRELTSSFHQFKRSKANPSDCHVWMSVPSDCHNLAILKSASTNDFVRRALTVMNLKHAMVLGVDMCVCVCVRERESVCVRACLLVNMMCDCDCGYNEVEFLGPIWICTNVQDLLLECAE